MKGIIGILVVYSYHIAGYRIWLKNENRIVWSKSVRFAPETSGKLMALFLERLNEQTDLEVGQRVGRHAIRSIVKMQPENVPNEQCDVDDSSEDQSWGTPPSAPPC